MSSYEELLKLAQENTRIQHQNLAELKRKREIEYTRFIREQEKERENYEKQKQHIALFAQKGVNSFTSSKRVSHIPSKLTTKSSPSSKRLSISKVAPSTKEPQVLKQPSSRPMQMSSPLTEPSKNNFERKMQSSIKEKSAAFLSFDELKKIAETKTEASKLRDLSHKNPVTSSRASISVQKSSTYTQENKSQQKDRLIKNASGSSTSFKKDMAGDRIQLSSRPKSAQDALKHQSLTSLPPKRPPPNGQKSNHSGLVGSRFAKYGPIDSEPPSMILRSENDSLRSHKPQIMHQPVKSPSTSDPSNLKPKAAASGKTNQSLKTLQPLQKKPRPSDSSSKYSRSTNKDTRQTRAPTPPLPRKRVEERPRRPFDPQDDIIDEDYAKKNISSIIGSIFGYDRSKYHDDDSDDDMVVSASRVRAEELRSARLGREEDEREEALERQRLLRLRQRKNKC